MVPPSLSHQFWALIAVQAVLNRRHDKISCQGYVVSLVLTVFFVTFGESSAFLIYGRVLSLFCLYVLYMYLDPIDSHIRIGILNVVSSTRLVINSIWTHVDYFFRVQMG